MTAAEASTSMAASTSTSLTAPTSERQPRQQPEDEVVKRTIKRRPARKQVGVDEIEKKQPAQNGQTFNVWYNKWAGGDRYDSYNAKEKSQTRCNIERDMGYTRADTSGNHYCCLYFARGCCPKGSECTYLHRLPMSDAVLPDASLDVFGREKHSDYRDDMGGVGSFGRQNRTLYIGKLHSGNGMENVLVKHFDEWGDIERIKTLQAKGVGFVTYYSELSAQFAKEAMMNQSADHDEVLNVRWATEDPNPRAKVFEYKRLVRIGQQGIGTKLTPEFIDAVRRMDELEGLVEPQQIAYEAGDVRSLPAEQRAALEAARARGTLSGNGNGAEPAARKTRTGEPSQAKGLLSGSALDSLKKAAALRKQKQAKALAAATKATAA